MEQNKNQQQEQEMKIEYIEQSSLPAIIKAEIDMQIATAKQFPRSISTFRKKSLELASTTEDIAQSCVYNLPRKQWNEQKGQFENKVIEGPSVRLAEICVNNWGNVRSSARVISNDGRVLVAQGVCHDLETNTAVSIEVRRRITNKSGKTFSEDMQVVTGNAACAIAFRNAVFKIIPAALIEDIYEEVKVVARGNAATLEKRRNKALKYFNDRDVTNERIFDVLNVKGVEEIDLDKLQILSGMKTAFTNQESTIEELFPTPEEKNKKQSQAALDETERLMKEAGTKKGK